MKKNQGSKFTVLFVIDRIPDHITLHIRHIILAFENIGNPVQIPFLMSLNQQLGIIINLALDMLSSDTVLLPPLKNLKNNLPEGEL